MKALIILAVLGLSCASPRRSILNDPSQNIGVPLPRQQPSSIIIPIIKSEGNPVTSSLLNGPVSSVSTFGVPLPSSDIQSKTDVSPVSHFGVTIPRSDLKSNIPFSSSTKFDASLPRSSLQSNNKFASTSNFGVPLPKSVPQSNNPVSLPESSPQLKNSKSSPSSFGVPLPQSVSDSEIFVLPKAAPLPKTVLPSSVNSGVALPESVSQFNNPKSSLSNFGVFLPESVPQFNNPKSSLSNFGVSLPESVSQFNNPRSSLSNFGVLLPESVSQFNNPKSSFSTFGVILPDTTPQLSNPKSPSSKFGAPLPKSPPQFDNQRSSFSNFGVSLPESPPQLSNPKSSFSNFGVSLPSSVPDSKLTNQFSSKSNSGISLTGSTPQLNSQFKMVTNFGIPLPTRSSHDELPTIRSDSKAPVPKSSGIKIPLKNVNILRSSLGSQQFIIEKESAEDAFSSEILAKNKFRSNKNPLFRSTEEENDDLFSTELFGDDDDDNRMAQISLGRRFHPLGVPRIKSPTLSLTNNEAIKSRTEPFSNPHMHKPSLTRFFLDDSLEIDDEFDYDNSDEDDNDRKIVVDLSPSVRAFNHETSDEQLFLHQDALNNYNFVDVKGAVNWGYKTDDQYQAHKVKKDGTMKGEFGWTAPEGKEVSIKYVADKGGYRVLSATGAYQDFAPDVLEERERHFQEHRKALARLNPTGFTDRSDVEISPIQVVPLTSIQNVGVPLPTVNDELPNPTGRFSGDDGFVSIQNINDFPLLINSHSVDAGKPDIFGVPIPAQDAFQISIDSQMTNFEKPRRIGIPLPSNIGRDNIQNDNIEVINNEKDIAPSINQFGVPLPSKVGGKLDQIDAIETSFSHGNRGSNTENMESKNKQSTVGVPIPSHSNIPRMDVNADHTTGIAFDTIGNNFNVGLPVMKDHHSQINDGVISSIDANIGVKIPKAEIKQTVLPNPSVQLSNVNIGIPLPQFPPSPRSEVDINMESELEPVGDLSVVSIPIIESKTGRIESHIASPEQSVVINKNILLKNKPATIPDLRSFGAVLPTIPHANDVKTGFISDIPEIRLTQRKQERVGVALPIAVAEIAEVSLPEMESLPAVQTVTNEASRDLGLKTSIQNEISRNNIVKTSNIALGIPLPPKIEVSVINEVKIPLPDMERQSDNIGVLIPDISRNQASVNLATHSLRNKNEGISKTNPLPVNNIGVPLPESNIASNILANQPIIRETDGSMDTSLKSSIQNEIKSITHNIEQISNIALGVHLPAKMEIATDKIVQSPSAIDKPTDISPTVGVKIPIKDLTGHMDNLEVLVTDVSKTPVIHKVSDHTVENTNQGLSAISSLSVNNVGIPLPGSDISENILNAPEITHEPSFVRSSGINLPSIKSSPTPKVSFGPTLSSGSIGVPLPSFPSEKIEAPSSKFITRSNIKKQTFGAALPNFSKHDSKIGNSERSRNVGVSLPSSLQFQQTDQSVLAGENPFNNLLRLSRSSP